MSEATVDQQITTIETEVVSLQEQANAVVVDSDETNASAAEVLGVLTKKKKTIEEVRTSIVKPLNDHVKDINAKFKPQTEALDEAIKTIKGKVGAYHVKVEEEKAKEQARLDAIREKANEKREEKGEEAIAEPVRQVEEKPQTTKTENAATTVKKVWKHRVISMGAMPDNVMKAILEEAYKKGIVDQVVRKFVNAGIREMKGVEIYEDTVVSVR
jgi:alpha-D-ribose 1-methylphosphonate 5-triphosphate synthase subunit PhnG